MKYRLKPILGLFLTFAALTIGACTVDNSTFDYDDFEQELLDEWIKVNVPDLVDNRQSEGYYIDITEESTTSTTPLMDIIASNDECWISYNITGYDLENNVVITRNEVTAWQQGTFYRQTHYTPIFLWVDEDDYLPEFLYNAITSELTIDGTTTSLEAGDKFTAYVPSAQIGYAATASTGYYGQSYLSSGHTLKAEIEIVALTSDVETTEEEYIESFILNNGTLNKSTDDEDTDYTDDEVEESNVAKESTQGEWSNAIDNIAGLYINRTYLPTDILDFTPAYTSALSSIYTPYYLTNGVSDLEERINAALAAFMEDKEFEIDTTMTGERIGYDQTASIWYICRTLDGFIIDTNIDEVSEIVNGVPVASSNVALTYEADDDEDDMITAWYYSIPQLRYGQWAAILTDSEYAYPDGVSASTSTYGASTEIAQYTPLLFQIYIEQVDY
ncbi:MAG: hypothetical protein SNH01_03590 [Rikenellaceae bacterium]